MPKVSVIVPVYNVENYIEKCLKTLVNQSMQDIEVIVVNDGSKDNSEKIIKDFIKRYPNKIIYLEKQNGGLSDARNYGLPYAKGEYIAFLDSDDYIEEDTYEKMYELAKKENSDMVECNFIWEYPNKRKVDIGQRYETKKEMIQKVRVVAWNKLIKREILEKTQIQFPKGYRYEDVEFTYKLVPYLKKVSFLNKPCIHYIQRPNSISNAQNERTKEIMDVLSHVIRFYKEQGFYKEYKNELEYIYARYLLCSSLMRIVKIKNKKVRKKLLNLTWENLNETFPNWKKNVILTNEKSKKNRYMRSVNKVTYKIYCLIFRIV